MKALIKYTVSIVIGLVASGSAGAQMVPAKDDRAFHHFDQVMSLHAYLEGKGKITSGPACRALNLLNSYSKEALSFVSSNGDAKAKTIHAETARFEKLIQDIRTSEGGFELAGMDSVEVDIKVLKRMVRTTSAASELVESLAFPFDLIFKERTSGIQKQVQETEKDSFKLIRALLKHFYLSAWLECHKEQDVLNKAVVTVAKAKSTSLTERAVLLGLRDGLHTSTSESLGAALGTFDSINSASEAR